MSGRFWTTRQLLASGTTPNDLTEEVRTGRLIRLRNGRYCTPDGPPELMRAVRLGGVATGPTAALALGVWAVPDDRLHVAVPANAARLRDPDDSAVAFRARPDVCLHWRSRLPGLAHAQPIVDPLRMVEHALRCQPAAHALAILDSALHLRFIRPADLAALARALPGALADLVAHSDGRAESGIETIARYRLRLAGLHVEVQVVIDGVGRVDLLVEGRLIVELDGRAFHDDPAAFARDRRRTAASTLTRYRTERFDYRQVLFEWPTVEAAIFAALAA